MPPRQLAQRGHGFLSLALLHGADKGIDADHEQNDGGVQTRRRSQQVDERTTKLVNENTPKPCLSGFGKRIEAVLEEAGLRFGWCEPGQTRVEYREQVAALPDMPRVPRILQAIMLCELP